MLMQDYDNTETAKAVIWLFNNDTQLHLAVQFAESGDPVDLAYALEQSMRPVLKKAIASSDWLQDIYRHPSQLFKINWYQVAEDVLQFVESPNVS